MVATSQITGHPMYFDEHRQKWVLEDGRLVEEVYKDLPCGHCKLTRTPEGHDGCLGELPGVINACCGHGSTDTAYVQFWDGSVLREKEATEEMARLK